MRPADPGERTLVAQQRVEPAIVAGEDLPELLDAEPERLRPEMGELGLGLSRRLQPDAGALLRAALREHELAAVLEPQPERRRLGPLRPGGQELDPARAHQVDPKLELAVVGREEQPLAPAAGALEPAAVELAQRRVERLQRGDVRRARLQDRARGHERVKLAHPRLDFR